MSACKTQNRDQTLRNERRRAREGVVTNCKGSGKVQFVYKGGLLYREFEAKDGRKSHQLLVPKECRSSVLKLANDSLMAGHLGIRWIVW